MTYMDHSLVLDLLRIHRSSGFGTNFNYHSWISKELKYLCMTIPKVSCTRIKTTLNQLNGGTNPAKMGHIHRTGVHLTDLCDEDALNAIFSNEWFRFAFVRNPYDRIFSAYKSKIGNFSDHQYGWLRSLIKAQNKYQGHL
jgi:hypothetical protein